MKKKIIISSFDDPNNPHYSGGGARAVHKLAKYLEKDYNILVISGNYKGAKKKIGSINYKHIGPKNFSPKIRMLIYNALLPFYTFKYTYDLWLESFTPPVSSSFLPVLFPKKTVGLCHMLSASDMERKYKVPFLVSIEKFALRFYRNIICVSQADAKLIKNINKKVNIVVIPNSSDISIKRNTNKKGKHILYIGRIEVDQKGLDLLLNAYKQTSSDYKLIIAGTGIKKELEKLSKITEKLDLKDKVVLTGYVSGKKKLKLIDESLYLVIPSRFETFCISMLEGFSRGKTAISFKLANLQWSKSASIQVKPFNIDQFSSAMLKLENNEKIRTELEENAYRLAQKYTHKEIMAKYKKFIRKTLETHKHSY